jgi:GTPase SAR1 family protein
VEEIDPTIEGAYRKELKESKTGEAWVLEVLDAAAQEEFTAMRDSWLRSCDMAIVCFSVTQKRSFDVQMYVDIFNRVKDETFWWPQK